MANSLAVSASLLKVSLPSIVNSDVEIKYRPSTPNNIKHWKVFENDQEIERFLRSIDEFFALRID